MTNKEAANFLSQVKFILLNSNSWLESTKTPIKESFDMAISALHAQTDGDCISRQAAIEETWKEPSYADPLNVLTEMRDRLMALPSAQPEPLVKESRTLVKDLVKEPCEDAVSREAAIDVAENAFVRGLLASPDIRRLPSAQPEIVRCGQCKYAEVADAQDNQDGYTCQFHRGSIWFSGSYCSWGERRTDAED